MSPRVEKVLARRYVNPRTRHADSPGEVLSDRELEVFRLIGAGRTTREVAAALFLSVKTIETHRERIKQKLAIRTAPDLVRRAVQWTHDCCPA